MRVWRCFFYFILKRNALLFIFEDKIAKSDNPVSYTHLEAEFRGDIKFTAKSKAGLETEYDKNAKVIVDNRKPDVDIKLNSEAVATNGQYYNKSVVANISISESNFDADKVDILINGQKLSKSGYTVSYTHLDVYKRQANDKPFYATKC